MRTKCEEIIHLDISFIMQLHIHSLIAMEKWVEANIYYGNTDPNTILLNRIKPLVYRLERERKLSTFHVLGQPGPRLQLRILTTEDFFDEILVSINSWDNLRGVRMEFRDYEGERETFGDAWTSVCKVMEAGTRCRLDFIDDRVSKTERFNTIGINHYLLNTMGFNVLMEASIHAQMVVERLAIINEYQTEDIMRRVKNLIGQRRNS